MPQEKRFGLDLVFIFDHIVPSFITSLFLSTNKGDSFWMVQNMGASKSFVQQLHCTHTELSGGCVYAGYINSWEKPKETHFTVSQKGFTVLNLCLPSAGVPVCKELSYGGQGGQQYASWDQSTHYMCYVSNTNFPNSELGTNVKKYLTSLRMAGNW